MDDTHDTERPAHGPQDDDATLWLLDHIVETDADGRDRFVTRLRETDEALAGRAAVLAHRQNVFDMLDADAEQLRRMPKTPSRLAARAEINDQSSPIVRFARGIGGRARDVARDLDDGLRPGDAVGPYRIVREIGRGGAGVVYLAERDDIGLRVAFKLLWNPFSRPLPSDRSDRAGSERVRERERFHAEQRSLARLRHSGIAQVYDAGETTDGRPFVVMELVEGVPVTDAARHLSVPGRVRLFGDLCDAVYHVHVRGLAHGDLKPANVLVRRDDAGRPVLKVVDFGVATPVRGAAPDASPSSVGAPPLTLAYASPERRSGALPSVASDVYALGVLLGEMFMASALRASEDARASTLSPIAAVVRRATTVDSRGRYPDVHALDEALCNAACDAVFASLPVVHAGPHPSPPNEQARPRAARRDEIEREQDRQNAVRRATARTWSLALLVLVAVVTAASLAALASQS